MNVVVVNDFAYVNGGASQVAILGAIALARRGHSVHFFSAGERSDERFAHSRVSRVWTGQSDILNDANRLRAIRQGIWNVAAAEKFSSLISSLDPSQTIVHLHSWTKALSSSVVKRAIDAGFPLVLTLHDYFSACPNGGFFDFKKSEICHLQPLSLACITRDCDARNYAHKLWRVGRHAVQQHFGTLPSGVRHFVVPSSFAERVLTPYLPREKMIYRIPNPVEVSDFKPITLHGRTGPIFVGRLAPEKGVLLLARVLADMKLPGTFVGDGPLRHQISAIIPDSRFTGWLPHGDVSSELLKAKFLVFPSQWYETQGLVVTEAAALGVPSIVSDACAARESVEDGITGSWFRSRDESDLREKIRFLMESPAVLDKMSKNAHEKFWACPPTLEHHARLLEDCYAEVLRLSPHASR